MRLRHSQQYNQGSNTSTKLYLAQQFYKNSGPITIKLNKFIFILSLTKQLC